MFAMYCRSHSPNLRCARSMLRDICWGLVVTWKSPEGLVSCSLHARHHQMSDQTTYPWLRPDTSAPVFLLSSSPSIHHFFSPVFFSSVRVCLSLYPVLFTPSTAIFCPWLGSSEVSKCAMIKQPMKSNVYFVLPIEFAHDVNHADVFHINS